MNTFIGESANGPIYLSKSDQNQHIAVTGATGTGKSVLMANLAAGLLSAGAGQDFDHDHLGLLRWSVGKGLAIVQQISRS